MHILLSILLAATGDLTYIDTVQDEISANEAGAVADNFIAMGAWVGLRSDMIECSIERSADSFWASCRGFKTATPDNLPLDVDVDHRVGSERVYMATSRAELTAQQAANMADVFIALNVWDGSRLNMRYCEAQRDTSAASGFSARCIGTKTVDPDDLPDGVRVVDRVE